MDGPSAQPRGAPPERPLRGGRRRRELRAGATLLLAGLCCAAAGSALWRQAPREPAAALLAGLAAQGLFACTALGGTLLAGTGLRRGLALGPPRLSAAELLALAAGFVCTSHALSVALSLAGLRETGTLAELDRIVAAAHGPSRGLALVAIGVAPALGEELLFRGLVQQRALPRLGRLGAVLASSLAFGVLHLDPVQSPAAFVLGLYLGAAALLGASVWAASLCHGANNALAVLVPQLALAVPAGSEPALAGALAAAGLLVLALVARRLARRPRS